MTLALQCCDYKKYIFGHSGDQLCISYLYLVFIHRVPGSQLRPLKFPVIRVINVSSVMLMKVAFGLHPRDARRTNPD